MEYLLEGDKCHKCEGVMLLQINVEKAQRKLVCENCNYTQEE